MAMNSDSGLIDVFQLFSNHKNKSIMFEVAKKAYIPLPPKASTNIHNQHPRFIVDSQNIEFNEFQNNLFHYKGDNEDAQGDNEDGHSVSGDSEEVFEVDSDRARGGVDKDELGLGDRSDEFGLGDGYNEIPVVGVDEAEQNINLELFEGHNSHPDDEFICDSKAKNVDAKIARLIKTNPFKQLVRTPIEFEISGVPCNHALARIRHLYGMSGIKEGITQFIHPSLSKSCFLRTYSSMISLIPDLCVWVDMKAAPVDPPPIKKKPSRLNLVRKRESHEKPKASRSGSVVCTRRRNPGHNKRTCKAIITSESNTGCKGCEEVVNQCTSRREPPEITYTSIPADITLYDRWERCNRLSVMFIKTKISDGIRGSVDQHVKVWDLLKAIDDQFVTLEKALASTLIMKFSSLRLTSVKGVHEHVMQMRDITDLWLN
ncbi:hypothetical protein Q3G72_004199 [Acer saccharum]|nr:hypothetical protein Q3G72_004199 [Acer saccharum]